MLYSLYEFQHTALMPWRILSDVTRGVLTHPWVPASYTQLGKSIVAGLDVLDSATARRPKPDWAIDEVAVGGRKVAVEMRVELEKPFCRLLHFAKQGPRALQPRVLVAAPMSGHHATLLRGTVKALLADHDVWITDWTDARDVALADGPFGVDSYIDYLLEFMRRLGPELHVIAVCQPAPLVLAAVSLLAQADDPAQPRSMTLMGGPIDTTAAPTEVTRLAETRPLSWFEKHLLTEVPSFYRGGGRVVYPGFLQLGGFISMNASRHFDAHLRFFRHLVRGDGDSAAQHRRFYDEYLAVMDVPAEYYIETVDRIFQRHLLPRGELDWRGVRVEPKAIETTALLTVEGELDDISAPGQTIAAHRLCSGLAAGKQQDLLQKGVGHYGIFNGRRWREDICPQIGAFIREHD
ncbi:poly(3-hydroxybutyrate) depolymerase [Tistlia consotensis]|uniref:Poly(3-hydroxybutyrate) depolymerase n=1 Tax=Tistlia consotensis USBA 355 TaxID=560819 RepID=A0A1Y6CLJ0_9PROT|nr:polyhydroxyalkanoate depolymerase [Tistlia consotensis]SMF60586.1 poly(3-hydroxybutyrate) depolymerase [Tistlia consotensis USBA 355]SNR93166.1 poly(3-hydroxybutyrate) depolymerase [Tistlia consotensis]